MTVYALKRMELRDPYRAVLQLEQLREDRAVDLRIPLLAEP